MSRFWKISAPRGQVSHAYCLTTFTRTIDGRRYTFGILIVGGELSLTEKKTGRQLRPAPHSCRPMFTPWGSLGILRQQGRSVVVALVSAYGEAPIAAYFDAVAADPKNRGAVELRIKAPPRLDGKCARCGCALVDHTRDSDCGCSRFVKARRP